MTSKRMIVGVSGSVTRPSRTTALVGEIVDRIATELGGDAHLVELAEHAPDLFAALTPDRLEGRGQKIVDIVESADILVVGTPVYRASMTGALKHLFDLVDHRSFVGKPVVLAATGGSLMHGLITEHQLRPLFGFLNALTLPTTIYAVESDFEKYLLTSAKLHERIDRVVAEAAHQVRNIPHVASQRVNASAI